MDLTERVALSVTDTCKATSLSRSRVYELIESKELPSLKVGGRRLILLRDLEAFLEAARQVA
jgi:excisionase family DNA binding protein